MYSLVICKLCGKIFHPVSASKDKEICPECLALLDGMYSKVYECIRDSKEASRFDPVYLSKAARISLDNIKLLISMGYLERDMQTWSDTPSERAVLAKEFEHELDKMTDRLRVTTYGGKVYMRRNKNLKVVRNNRHSEEIC